ncbi:hypothetical protein D3C71_1687600 [compost metagenome]
MQGVRQDLGLSSSDTSQDAYIMSLSKNDVMDKFLNSYGSVILGTDSRRIINYIFGVNVTGLSGLEHARLSVYSKGQWVLNNPTNVLIISSSKHDIDLYVAATDYYASQLGTYSVPVDLKNSLLALGFTYDATTEILTYHSTNGESVPDSLKVTVMGLLVTCINTNLSNL